MGCVTRWLFLPVLCTVSVLHLAAQCPARPVSGTEVQDAYTVTPQNGVLQADFSLGYSVDQQGYTHYCYQYQSPTGVVEAPTLRLNPGDQFQLNVTNVIQDSDASKMRQRARFVAMAGWQRSAQPMSIFMACPFRPPAIRTT